MTKKDPMGDRFKRYEQVTDHFLTRRTPVILRLDGRAFHTLTSACQKPFDEHFAFAMLRTAKELCREIQGAKLAYVQSDEISILLTDYDTVTTEPWFDYRIQKMCSVAAALAAGFFTDFYDYSNQNLLPFDSPLQYTPISFDCRVFNVPENDVVNCFLWRQRDAERNSIMSLAQSLFSHSELQNLSSSQLQDKCLLEKGINWNTCSTWQKRGTCVKKVTLSPRVFDPDAVLPSECVDNKDLRSYSATHWVEDLEIPIFSQDRSYIESLLPKPDDGGLTVKRQSR